MKSYLNITEIKGILLDVDGTMYNQNKLNFCMLREILKVNIRQPLYLYVLLKWLYIFRKEREQLRLVEDQIELLNTKQFAFMSEKYGISEIFIKSIVQEWILTKPLPFLHLYIKAGLYNFLEYCNQISLKIGVYSDYPAEKKVEALGCARYCDLFLSSTSPEVNVFKPAPKGILLACEIWNLNPVQLLYVGDRVEVDALAASNAGCQFVLIGRASNKNYESVPDFQELTNRFKSSCNRENS